VLRQLCEKNSRKNQTSMTAGRAEDTSHGMAGWQAYLNVPVALAQGVQAQLVCDLGGIHGVGQVLRAVSANGEREKEHITPTKWTMITR
jgi:hypothetical protein